LDKKAGEDLKTDADRIKEILSFCGRGAGIRFAAVKPEVYEGVTELRFKTGWPPEIFYGRECRFLSDAGEILKTPCSGATMSREEISDIFCALCGYSAYSHQEELGRGFITIGGGHRVGICGTAVYKGGRLAVMRDLTSLNIRVAREVHGAADEIMERALADGLCGLLISGPPCSGKTTVLRDLARQLSYGKLGRPVKTSVVDERGEIAAVWQGEPQNDMGPCCDVLNLSHKADGIEAAVRTLSPEYIICDEIGTEEDAEAILHAANCGVSFAASIHAENEDELLKKRIAARLLDAGIFGRIVLLKGPGRGMRILDMESAGDRVEIVGDAAGLYGLHNGGFDKISRFVTA